jgi:hypothetical protein
MAKSECYKKEQSTPRISIRGAFLSFQAVSLQKARIAPFLIRQPSSNTHVYPPKETGKAPLFTHNFTNCHLLDNTALDVDHGGSSVSTKIPASLLILLLHLYHNSKHAGPRTARIDFFDFTCFLLCSSNYSTPSTPFRLAFNERRHQFDSSETRWDAFRPGLLHTLLMVKALRS